MSEIIEYKIKKYINNEDDQSLSISQNIGDTTLLCKIVDLDDKSVTIKVLHVNYYFNDEFISIGDVYKLSLIDPDEDDYSFEFIYTYQFTTSLLHKNSFRLLLGWKEGVGWEFMLVM